ncbi:MAG: cupin domain-containing protein, partial [Lachnospiraceae bacterium]
MGREESSLNLQANLNTGDAVFVPAGTWHNIINTGRSPLKLSSVYAPPHHKHGTVHRTKEEAAREE